MMREAGVHVAVPHDIAALRFQGAVAEEICQLDHLYPFSRLLML
jgi:hypothetical protein